jgi:hypothetical protein
MARPFCQPVIRRPAAKYQMTETDYTPQYRVFFEYADQASMLLRFEAREKMITFSHLVPSNQSAGNMTEYYIPDGEIDFFQLGRKGRWVRKEHLTEFKFD